MKLTAFAPGKIILSGEYAVVFGYPGIAIPSEQGVRIMGHVLRNDGIMIEWKGIEGNKRWNEYVMDIVERCDRAARDVETPLRGRNDVSTGNGTITIDNHLPLGKGMGSSTALVIAIARCLIGEDCHDQALAIEDAVNSGHSGLDFAVIWHGKPVKFVKEHEPELIDFAIPGYELIDTGTPNETTTELVAWVKERKDETEVAKALETIGKCTERILSLPSAAEDRFPQMREIIRDHHRAQVVLGVVPEHVQKLIADIESKGGAAKVIGAGGRSGGGGMVLSLQSSQ